MKKLFLALALAACGPGLQAPKLKSLEKMDGALMLYWTNVETGCTAVVGERKLASEAFAQLFSVPGDVNNKHDATATTDATYTYRVRCQKAGTYSPWSDEMANNPVK